MSVCYSLPFITFYQPNQHCIYQVFFLFDAFQSSKWSCSPVPGTCSCMLFKPSECPSLRACCSYSPNCSCAGILAEIRFSASSQTNWQWIMEQPPGRLMKLCNVIAVLPVVPNLCLQQRSEFEDTVTREAKLAQQTQLFVLPPGTANAIVHWRWSADTHKRISAR